MNSEKVTLSLPGKPWYRRAVFHGLGVIMRCLTTHRERRRELNVRL